MVLSTYFPFFYQTFFSFFAIFTQEANPTNLLTIRDSAQYIFLSNLSIHNKQEKTAHPSPSLFNVRMQSW